MSDGAALVGSSYGSARNKGEGNGLKITSLPRGSKHASCMLLVSTFTTSIGLEAAVPMIPARKLALRVRDKLKHERVCCHRLTRCGWL